MTVCPTCGHYGTVARHLPVRPLVPSRENVEAQRQIDKFLRLLEQGVEMMEAAASAFTDEPEEARC